jgi:LPXTG-motif cell wall-anchored protein
VAFVPEVAPVTPPATLPPPPPPAAAAPPSQTPVAVTVGMGTSTFVLIGLIAVIGIAALVWFTKKRG